MPRKYMSGGLGGMDMGGGTRSGSSGTRTMADANKRINNRSVSRVTKLGRAGKITPKQTANATRKAMSKNLKDVKTILRSGRKLNSTVKRGNVLKKGKK